MIGGSSPFVIRACSMIIVKKNKNAGRDGPGIVLGSIVASKPYFLHMT
jgi:hypothetical protein